MYTHVYVSKKFWRILIWRLLRQSAKPPNLIPHQIFRLYGKLQCTHHKLTSNLHVTYIMSCKSHKTDKYTVKRHQYAHENIMRINQNGPLKKFTRFSFQRFMYYNVWRDKNLCSTNICDWCLTRIIHINKVVQKNVTLQHAMFNIECSTCTMHLLPWFLCQLQFCLCLLQSTPYP